LLEVWSDSGGSGKCMGNKAKGQRVHTITQASRFWPVVKDVPQMRVAENASHLVTGHAQAQIYFGGDVFLGEGRPKARPTGAGVEFGVRAEQRVRAADAAVKTWLVVIVIGAAEGPLGIGAPGDIKLVGAERPTPLGIALDHFCHGLDAQARPVVREFGDLHRTGIALCGSIIS